MLIILFVAPGGTATSNGSGEGHRRCGCSRRHHLFPRRHFADVVVAEDPDVLALQEVRHDSAFVNNSRRTDHWNDPAQSKEDAGSQVEHLLSHLASARRRRLGSGSANASSNSSSAEREGGAQYYQFVFHPAMAMMDRCAVLFAQLPPTRDCCAETDWCIATRRAC